MTALPEDGRALLAAISDALDLPMPSLNPADEREFERLALMRMTGVRTIITYAEQPWAAEHMRQHIAAYPVTYTPWTPARKDTSDADQAPVGESTTAAACARCRAPFDPADTRHDGHAQHGSGLFCRRCVDHCHEAGDADHRCAVCCAPIGDESTGGTR